MKKTLATLLILFTPICLVGCDNVNNQDVGTVTGGVLGGLIGSRFGGGTGQMVAIGAGAVTGAYLGAQIGKSMDMQDRARMNNAFENNAVGQPAYWQNSNTGVAYDITPVHNVSYDGNPYCREYRSTAIINGKHQQIYGTACRQPDGSWQIVNTN
jgi:surface antigen